MTNPLLGSLADPFTSAALNTAVWNATSGTGVSLVAPGRVGVQAASVYPSLGASGPTKRQGSPCTPG
ncbi:hypothetical protein E6W39_24175 [Kitasatospora acidiphila]|uniref:Uncharacterized protein n=1 Tax=Kitasatospora acidiphila TaxID=2567942 RepID=A0A540W8Q9_9ACTN|nr:hypothetical protein [Kitasatospora acidiphila]TQF04754.1 hypothetical protein E6W39_24175 [Kitasatospora acidiphila]